MTNRPTNTGSDISDAIWFMMGRITDKELEYLSGQKGIRLTRESKAIPPYNPHSDCRQLRTKGSPLKQIDWLDDVIGLFPDRKLADVIRCTPQAVAQYRRRYGIPERWDEESPDLPFPTEQLEGYSEETATQTREPPQETAAGDQLVPLMAEISRLKRELQQKDLELKLQNLRLEMSKGFVVKLEEYIKLKGE